MYYTKTCINELQLTLFSPFDTKCEKLNLLREASENIFLGHLGVWVICISQCCSWSAALDGGGCPPIPFKTFVDHIAIFN